MKINVWNWSTISQKEKAAIFSRSESGIEDVKKGVSEIIEAVKKDGDKALKKYSLQFDKCDLNKNPLRVSVAEINEAKNSLSREVKEAIKFAIKNVKAFHSRQKVESLPLQEISPGIFGGEIAMPIESVAIYVPNGRGNFPSMLYMAAVPAVIAKVKRVVVTSPPNSEGKVDPATLYAASLLGISEIYRLGGAQAVAAFTFGTESIKPCVKIVGPGSKFVTAAKRLLFGQVDVGLPAGPSESIVIADESANPNLVALDLLTEAEHGSDSAALLITPSKKLASSIIDKIEAEVTTLGEVRKKFVCDVLSNFGGIIITKDIEEAANIANEIATEHLQLAVKNPAKLAKQIVNAGEILLGQTPFSAANYAIGPNAILPTGGNAKTFSALSVRDFYKFSSLIKVDKKGLTTLSPHVEKLAKYEGFETHRNAITKR